MLAHAEETADRQDQRVDLMVLDGEVGDFADRLVLLVVDVQALELGREHFVLRDGREFGFGRRGAGSLGLFCERRCGEQRKGCCEQCKFLHIVLRCGTDGGQCNAGTNVQRFCLQRFRTPRGGPRRAAPAWIAPNRKRAASQPQSPERGASRVWHESYVSSRWRSEERRVGKECRSRWSPYH